MLFAAALVFTSCSNDSDSAGTPKHAVTFSVDGSYGMITATVGGSEIHSGDEVEQGKIVEFTATADNPATYNVDFWTVSAGTFEAGTGTIGSTSAKLKVVQPATVTVKFKPVGTPPTKVNVTFGVSGTGGTLKAEVDGTEITSPAQVRKNKTIVFTARPENAGYAVEKWTNGGSPIAGETATVYTHTVTADADIAVHFKTVTAYDIYVSVTSNYKAYVYKNGSPAALSAENPANRLDCYTVKALGTQVYIAGNELVYSIAKPCVWKADGSRHWSGTNGWSSARDIALHNGKTLVAGKTYDGTDAGASITDISDPAHPAVTFLYKITPPVNNAEAQALCSGSGKVYAAGYKENGSTQTAFLWTLSDGGTVSEVELGIMQISVHDSGQSIAGVCIQGGSVYVAGKKLWKVDGTTVTEINVPDANIITAVCAHGTAVYAAGKKMNADPAVWKIEGASASLYTTFSVNSSHIYALCAFGSTLFAAGTIYDGLDKPVWWSIADDLTVTEHKLGTDSGVAHGICVTAR